MCHILTSYQCNHTYLDTRPLCTPHKIRLVTHLNLQRKRNLNRTPGLFSCFYISSSRHVPTPVCKLPPGKQEILDYCPECKEDIRKESRRLLVERRKALQKRGVIPGDVRSEDSGSRLKLPDPPVSQNTARRAVPEQRGEGLKPTPSTQHARQDASRAAESYGWNRSPATQTDKPLPQKPLPLTPVSFPPNLPYAERMALVQAAHRQQDSPSQGTRDSAPLPPALVSSYVSPSNADSQAPGPAPPLTTQQPLHQEPGIDWDRWDQAKQGNHGRMPPMPELPTPIRPLNIKTPTPTKGRGMTRVERKPVPPRKEIALAGLPLSAGARLPKGAKKPVSFPLQNREGGDVSPLTSPVRERSGERAEDVMNVLDSCLKQALGEWQPEQTLAAPAPVFRQTKW
ncbi:hypothetical protein WAI453_003563 [Rhynchosporium graminicola]|uniref:Uncharacterized protein n=1 Tax=Rhynchosporium graminicola TaxID=2792576 RepID=A0A1E1LRS5_9HELO|nr:uncharacterized protein RCO7_01608 [Rhynchosporium commune]